MNYGESELIPNPFLPSYWHCLGFDSCKWADKTLPAVEMAKKWKPEMSYGILFSGPCGVGKTTMMLHNFHKLFLHGKTSLFWFPMVSGISQIKAEMNESPKTKKRLLNSEFVFIDDLGVENTSDWVSELVFEVLDYRSQKLKTTFISTNLTFEEIKNRYSERITSRLKEMCVFCKVEGEDHRNKKFKQNMQEIQEEMYRK